MAIDRSDRYPGRFDVPTLAQPQGAFKNKTGPAAVDGTYLEKDWANDFAGFFSSLLQGVSANGSVDEVGASQYYDAMLNSQTYTGIPRAPTASQGTSTTQIATTAFVAGRDVQEGSNGNGYYRIHPTGFIEQFGQAPNISADATKVVSFPISFSAAPLYINWMNEAALSQGATGSLTVDNITVSQFDLVNGMVSSTPGAFWMAVGY